MASTGEVGCFGDDGDEALLQALAATGFRPPRKGVLLSLGPMSERVSFLEEARALSEELGLALYAKLMPIALETNGSEREARRLHSMTFTRPCWTRS